jgi:hypothetical protein
LAPRAILQKTGDAAHGVFALMDENLAEVPAGIQRQHPVETFERRGHIEGHKRQRNLDSYQQPDDQDD